MTRFPALCAALAAAATFSSGGFAQGGGPLVGVVDSQVFRLSEPAGWRRFAPGALAPVSLHEQLDELDYRAFHFTVVADPDAGFYARGGGFDVAALRQPGLKVIGPHGPDASADCFTLMTCLAVLDAWSRIRPNHEAIIIVLDARSGVVSRALREAAERSRLGWVTRPFAETDAPAPPSWSQIAEEVERTLPAHRRATDLDAAAGRLAIVARGGSGEPPVDAPFIIAGGDGAVIVDASVAPPWRLEDAVGDGALTVVTQASWREGAGGLDARQASALGADVVLVGHDAARGGPYR